MDSQGKFDVFEKEALRAGFLLNKVVHDTIETMHFSDSAGYHMFWMTPWDNHWVVGIRGPRPRLLYRIGNSEKIDEFLLELMQLITKPGRSPDVTEDMRASYNLQELSLLEWHTAKRNRIRDAYARMGWEQLTRDDKKIAWDQMWRVCDFENSHSVAPQPSLTWDIQHARDFPEESEERQELVHDLEQKCLKAMRCVGDDVWLALEFHHPCYRFHTQSMSSTLHPWPVSPFPDRDPAHFVTADFRCGITTV
ncbi:MAG: DUF2716 domain-containing protein, partial [Planctomycetales bacterium]